ncbi:arylamine N-acetyltransferase [Maricurvus nonylphenolicus]|uniref:arylamine N-acetyltransferase family protein n=1 Tax=Maricurvus nonylphenolicus TaxID=1008307 RepID=UPI0036F328E7
MKSSLMNCSEITQSYLEALDLSVEAQDKTFLDNLQSRHIARFSFNNLGVVLGQELPLDLPALFDKIVVKGRGGYCFEHNKLVFHVLQELGFNVRLLVARVVNNRDVDAARTHRITLLELDGQQMIVDAGFGAMGPYHPVLLPQGQEESDSHYRITEDGNGLFRMQVLKEGDYFTLYTFDMNTYTDADCLLGHFYSHRHPDAAFVNNLVVSRKLAEVTYSLRNAEFHTITASDTLVAPVHDTQRLHILLTEVFELDVDMAISEFLFERFVVSVS